MPKLLRVRKDGDPVLRRRAKKVSRVDPSLRTLVEDMFYTMYNNDQRGIGLAAPQIGVSLRIIVIDMQDDEHDPVALINPEIVKQSATTLLGTEGCLSVPGLRGDVSRAEWVMVKARDDQGHQKRLRADGWFARCLQHEIDHLDGILFTDKAENVRDVAEDEVAEERARREAAGEKVPACI
ncbi:MAG TPA: peptide deformylase [Chloroflexota bacterium]|nr:peptide deformylase [Chloroflexota bacterium]